VSGDDSFPRLSPRWIVHLRNPDEILRSGFADPDIAGSHVSTSVGRTCTSII
jgi:hypothetical protein